MTSKSQIKYYSALKLKKYRKFERKFLAEGKRLIEEGIKSNYECDRVFITQPFYNVEGKFLLEITNKNIPVDIIPLYDLLKFTSTKNPQGIIAVFKMTNNKPNLVKKKAIIGLENISDPGNLGTILRSCDWFGIKDVMISEGSAEIYNPKVLRASMGAVFNLNIFEDADLINGIKILKNKNYAAFYADMIGLNYKKINWRKNTIVTFCNEAKGPSDELKEVCETSLTIPKKGNIDSLNVAAAAAIIISEMQLS